MPVTKHFLFLLFFFLMFWHIAALKFRISLVFKFIFDLSPFYVEELIREKKNIPLCPGLLIMTPSRISVWGHLRELCLALRGERTSPPLQNAALQIYLLAFTKGLSFIILQIKFTPIRLNAPCYSSLYLWREADLWRCLLTNVMIPQTLSVLGMNQARKIPHGRLNSY